MSDIHGTTRRASARKTLVGAAVVSVLAALVSLVLYYLVLAAFVAASTMSRIGEPALTLPLGATLFLEAIIYGGVAFSVAVAILTFRALGPLTVRLVRNVFADLIVLLGCGLMGAALGLWAGILAQGVLFDVLGLLGATVGFVLAAGLALVRLRDLKSAELVESPAT